MDLAGIGLRRGTDWRSATQPVGYYPKTNGVITLAHDGVQFLAWTPSVSVLRPPGDPSLGGVHATGISPTGREFYYGTTPLPNPYASYGLWECRDDGSVLTWDECYYVKKPAGAGQTHHSHDGRLWVRECAQGGIEGAVDGKPFLFWPGTETMWPRCASDGMHVAIASWASVGPTVRLWFGTFAELAALTPLEPSMSNHLDTVQRERAKYPAPEYGLNAQGERVLLNPMGNDNAARISRAVAWTHRDEGWGLLDKPTGNNVLGYSVDVIINAREQQIVDCLGSSEAECIPVWNPLEWRDDYAARWRPALPPDDRRSRPIRPTRRRPTIWPRA